MSGFTEEWLAQRNRDVFGVAHCGCPLQGPHGAQCPTILGDMARMDAELPQDLRPEWMIEAECTKLLEEDGWRALRTDPVSDRSKGKGFGEVGMADHCYFRYGPVKEPILRYPEFPEVMSRCDVLWVEFKSASGKPAKKQIEWHQKERARGALTLIAGVDFQASIQGFMDWYRCSGLSRAVTPIGEKA